MNTIEEQKEEMFRLLEIYDGYEALQDVSETLTGCGCDCGYGEGVLGKLTYIVSIITSHSDPTLYDRKTDFHDTTLARILDDRNMDNRRKAECLLGLRKPSP